MVLIRDQLFVGFSWEGMELMVVSKWYGVVSAAALLVLSSFLFVGTAGATTLFFSDLVSQQPNNCGRGGHDPCITAGELSGSVDFTVTGATTVDITLTNSATNELTISALYFSVSSNVTGLTLISAFHSFEGDVLAGWSLNASTGDGGPTHGDGFGVHDFSLIDGMGTSTDKIGVGESIVFSLTIAGTGGYTMSDFIQFSEQTGGGTNTLTLAAAKWDNGDGSLNFPIEDNDSGFGAVIPEPSTALLMGLGLVGMGLRRRRE